MPSSLISVTIVLLFVGALVNVAAAQQDAAAQPDAAARWRVEAKGSTLTVAGRELQVGFRQSTAWTIARISYRGTQLVGPHGSQGTVIANPKFVGTGHGGEVVRRFFVRCDGKEHDVTDQPASLDGEQVTVIKESAIGPFHHVAEIEFPQSGAHLLQRYRYRVDGSLDQFNRMYAFMHCVENPFKDYLAVLGDQSGMEGRADQDDGKFQLKRDVKAVVYYSQEKKLGMALVYPEVYVGAKAKTGRPNEAVSNMIWDRKTDNKLYFTAGIREQGYKVGDTFAYHLKFTPFAAEPDQWKTIARKLAAETDF